MTDATETLDTDAQDIPLTDDRHIVEPPKMGGFAVYEERPDAEIKVNGFAVLYDGADSPTVVRAVPAMFQVRLVNVETRNVEGVVNGDPNDLLGLVAAERIDD